MGCGNSKAQKDAASSPSQVGAGNSAAMMASQQQQQQQQQQYQAQPQPQQNQQQQQQQQYQKQQQQQQQQYEQQRYQQESVPVSAQSRREDQTNRSYSETQERYQHMESPEKMQSLYQSPLQNAKQQSTPAKGSARKEDYPQTYDKQESSDNEDDAVYSNQHSGNPSHRNNDNHFEQSGRLQTPSQAEQAASVNQSKVMKIPKEDGTGPNILFSFDFANKDFHYYNFKKDQWDLNNLNRSTDDCPKCPLFKYKVQGEEAEGLQFAKYMSYIALSDEVIFIIGGYSSYYSCLEYNIISNKFYAREPLKVFRNNPSLCRYGQYVYAVSGDLLDKFSTDVARYDTQRNEWVTLPELPSPQGFASVAVINSVKGAAPSEKTLKLAALGGLSQKFPKTYTTVLSLFSFDEQKWTSFDLSRFIEPKVPRFSHCPIVQTKEGDIIIFGSEGSRSVHRFDPFNMKMTTAGRLPNDEVFNESMKSKEAFCQNDKIYCLAYKLGLKAYRGSLSTNKWEVI